MDQAAFERFLDDCLYGDDIEDIYYCDVCAKAMTGLDAIRHECDCELAPADEEPDAADIADLLGW